MNKKYIVITGGVISGLGKGVALASIGNLLSFDYKVVPLKCDGYLNVDPGTMNPLEHGEVFVLDDGGEVDMDFGHYERFLSIFCKTDWNLTMGKVFNKIREKERRGDYLGKTVQLVPHVSDWIRDHFISVSEETNSDITLIEIGGTVGDMENEIYLDAVRSLSRKVGKENVLFIHLTYVPVASGVNEQKSKPTQQSVSLLRQRGIEPDIIIARCSEYLTKEIKEKISSHSNLSVEEIISGVDVDDIYKIPLIFEEQGISKLISEKLNLPLNPNLEKWKNLISNRENPLREITVGIVGKYTRLGDSYISIIESLNHCASYFSTKINVKLIDSDNMGSLDNISGVIIPGGFGSRGIEGKINAIKYCRENNIPFLGICYGLQMAVIEYARNVCGLGDANTTEVNESTPFPVIDFIEEQRNVNEKGGTMRKGAYPAVINEGSLIHSIYGSLNVFERHRHRYEVNPLYHDILLKNGLVLSGMSPNGSLVEFIELPKEKHCYFVATQSHPELKSSLLHPAPLFKGFVEAILNKENLI